MKPLALKTVVVGTDLSDEVLPALRTAAALAKLAAARLFVVHATPAAAEHPGHTLDAHLRAAGLEQGLLAGVVVQPGPAGATVGQQARRVGADVIVLGPHRRDRTRPLGPTADHVVRSSEVPCLILPVALPLPLRNVLAPVNPSDAAQGALAVALTWASALRQRRTSVAREQTRLVAFQVAGSRPDGGLSADPSALEREVTSVRNQLADIAGVDVQHAVVDSTDIARSILQHAESTPFDLIVIGTRGQRTSGPAALGSVSSAVVRDTARPVLLVPPALWRADGSPPTP